MCRSHSCFKHILFIVHIYEIVFECSLGILSTGPLSIFLISRTDSQTKICPYWVVVNAHSRWHNRAFVWSEADKETADKVMFGRDNFPVPQVTSVHVFLSPSRRKRETVLRQFLTQHRMCKTLTQGLCFLLVFIAMCLLYINNKDKHSALVFFSKHELLWKYQ